MSVKLTTKQQAKIANILSTVGLADSIEALKDAATTQEAKAIKVARKALAKELAKLDKALIVYGIDIAIDEAKASITSVETKIKKK
jgi:hypothetical protein